MEKVQLIFARGHSTGSYAIRLRYQSRWSHVAVIIGDMVHETVHPDGVVKTPLQEFKDRYGDGNWERIRRARLAVAGELIAGASVRLVGRGWHRVWHAQTG